MLDWDQNRFRRHFLAIILGLLLIFIFYSNSIWQPNREFTTNPVYFEPDPDIQGYLRNFSLILPYLLVLFLIGLIFIQYVKLIKNNLLRILVRLGLLLFLIFALAQITGLDLFTLDESKLQPTEIDPTDGPTGDPTIQTSLPSVITSEQAIQNTSGYYSNSTLDKAFNLFAGFFLLILFGFVFVMFVFFRTRLKRTSKKILIDRQSQHPHPFNSVDKVRKQIITNYLEISYLLERLGANDDYSLTPKEFEIDVYNHVTRLKEFKILTELYKLARFSTQPISGEHIEKGEKAVEVIKSILLNSESDIRKKS